MNVTRRSFVGGIGAGAAALGTLAATPAPAAAQLVYQPADWHLADFDKLLKQKARIKQVYDVESIKDGGVFSPIKNSFNGLHFGFGIPADQIRVVAALRGQANLLNFDDSMWAKYRLGEYTQIDDPKTSKPATRNIYYPKKGYQSTDMNDRQSVHQDTGIEALMARGMQMLSCHNATETIVVGIIKRFSLTLTQEEVVHDMQSHMLPGVISVPAMVAAIAVLQTDGGYSYITG